MVKILERILSDHIWDLLHKNDFVSCDQHGFRAVCSCVRQLLECLHDWTGNFDKKISTDIVYLSNRVAFESVPHKRLIYKLKLAGIYIYIYIRVYLQSALGHINASGRGKAVLRRSQAVFKCLQWWGIDSFLAEGIPVKHSTSKKWIFGSVMTRPGGSNFFIVVVPHEPIGTRRKAVAGDGYKTMFDLVGHHQPRLSPPLCQIRPAQLPKHGRRTSCAIPSAFVKNNTGTPAVYHLQPVDVMFVVGVPHSGAVV